MSKPEKAKIDDSTLSVTLTVGQLKEIIHQEMQKSSNGNGHHDGLLLTADQAAERWSVPVSWIRDMARRGELPSVHLGHYVRFTTEDLDQYIKDHRK